MNIYTIDFEKLCDLFIDTIEEIVFDGGNLHQSFSLENKDDIKKAMNLFLQKTFEQYQIVEIKNSFVEQQKEEVYEKKKLLH
jgi:hypothetical protein